jgi:Flp pilus assembly protein TadG
MEEIVCQVARSGRCRRTSRLLPYLYSRRGRERGAIAVMFVVLLMVILGFIGLALDLSRVYNRKAEMQAVADGVAISAATRLNGTSSGISEAIQVARDVMENGVDVLRPKYQYNQVMVFSDAALKFSRSADGSTGWLDAASARASPRGLSFAKVETGELDSRYGTVNMMFMPVLSPSLASVDVRHTTVAGRAGIGVTPIAICAMSPNEVEGRTNASGNDELVEYGFRRGVGYDLMKLSPENDTGTNFLVDPVSPPGPGSSASNFSLSTVAPYVCTGTVALPNVSNASIRVQSGFPIGSLYEQLNSRFNLSNGKCDPATAPPDTNIRQFSLANITWMSPRPIHQTAVLETVIDNRRRTIADLPPPNHPTAADYGPLWVFARAVRRSSYIPGQSEPANGYATFDATPAIWTSLYSAGLGLSGYPSPSGIATPYSTQLQSPPATRPGTRHRRVLNVPLLQCPVSGATATVRAIGKFFMTVPAEAGAIHAEFAGIATEQSIVGPVEIYR